MKRYFEELYNILFENNFEIAKENLSIRKAILTLILSSLFLFLSKYHYTQGFLAEFRYIFSIIFSIITIIIFWFISTCFFNSIAQCFGKKDTFKKLFTLSSYSLVPYIFIAPLELMKRFSDIGYFWGTKLEILLFLWVIFLYASSLKETYDLEKSSAILLIFIPVISFAFALIWLIGTFINISYIYNV